MPRETAAISAQVLCTPFNHASVYSVTSSKARTYGACVFSCNLPPALLAAEWPGSFTQYCGNAGLERKLTVEEKFRSGLSGDNPALNKRRGFVTALPVAQCYSVINCSLDHVVDSRRNDGLFDRGAGGGSGGWGGRIGLQLI